MKMKMNEFVMKEQKNFVYMCSFEIIYENLHCSLFEYMRNVKFILRNVHFAAYRKFMLIGD